LKILKSVSKKDVLMALNKYRKYLHKISKKIIFFSSILPKIAKERLNKRFFQNMMLRDIRKAPCSGIAFLLMIFKHEASAKVTIYGFQKDLEHPPVAVYTIQKGINRPKVEKQLPSLLGNKST
jgi:hypothetical protein